MVDQVKITSTGLETRVEIEGVDISHLVARVLWEHPANHTAVATLVLRPGAAAHLTADETRVLRSVADFVPEEVLP